MTGARAVLLLGALSAASSSGCASSGHSTGMPHDAPEILGLDTATPALVGTLVRVTGRSLDVAGNDAQLLVTSEGQVASLASAESMPTSGSERLFAFNADAIARLGAGSHDLTVAIVGSGAESAPFDATITIATSLPVSLSDAPGGSVHRNDVAIVHGSGFLATGEGQVQAHFVGMFTPAAGGAASHVDVSLPALPAERFARDRGLVRLSTAIGGPQPGSFVGTMQLDSMLSSGGTTSSASEPVTLQFLGPELFNVSPVMFSLGQYVTVSGAGFLGGSDPPDEATIIRLNGMFTPDDGMPVAVHDGELVPEWRSGSEVRFVVDTMEQEGVLVSSVFHARRGTFVGQATAVTVSGRAETVGSTVPVMFVLGPVRQVVWVRFLPGYYDSLSKFGLSVAVDEIAQGIERRIEDIYVDYNVDIRTEEPTDFAVTGYATLDIGGADPNGAGLFGYDNSPGKDVGNLRIFDSIGGANAAVQADGYPGFGGVFTESYLYWSTHPDLPGHRPPGAPDPEPLFDEIFDPVRRIPATQAEVAGMGTSSTRIIAVQRAVAALGSIIGETCAHELGHSLGLAQPYGDPMAYHNDFDGDGCLMDSGGSRPLAERIQDPSAARSQFCYDEPTYLTDILGK